jgi:hypothetical protein
MPRWCRSTCCRWQCQRFDAFVGVNGGTDEAMGLELDHVNLALALMGSQADPARRWVSVQATATSPAWSAWTR